MAWGHVEKICETYQRAPSLHKQGTHVVCTDEKTVMQALERKYATKPTKPGFIERREFEYIRRGTQVVVANFHVATGRVIESTISPTRTELDFAAHIRATVASDPKASWIFVTDQLDSHKSESLVRLVAEVCELDEELGTKGKRGILHDMATRRAFLEDESHRVRFVYTPRHCSWLNQVEIWFSILVRRLLKRASSDRSMSNGSASRRSSATSTKCSPSRSSGRIPAACCRRDAVWIDIPAGVI